jgi:drug/metabolite transporter (DMT)-like permease
VAAAPLPTVKDPPAAGAVAGWRTGVVLAAAGAVLFSGKAIIVKLAYRHGVDPVTLIMLRMAMALPFFLVLAAWAGRGRDALAGRDWAAVVGLGFTGYYLSSFLDFIGLQYITASLERLILYLSPTMVLLLGRVLYGRRVGRTQLAALALSYVGVLLVFGHELSLEGRDVLFGSGLVFASTVTYALYLVYSGQVVARIGAARLTGLATSVACVLCIGQFLLLRPLQVLEALPAEVWWLSLVNGTLCTFAPVLMLMLAIARIGPGLTSQVGLVGPVSTVMLGVGILGEPFTVWTAAGSALVVAGVLWLSRVR